MRRANKTTVYTSTGPDYPGFRGSYRITVGNETAGDTATDCDMLDAGDGVVVKEAMSIASGIGSGCEVYVRPGTYAMTVSGIDIYGGCVLTGAGYGTVFVPLSDGGNVFTLRDSGSVLRNVRFYSPETMVTGSGGLVAVREDCVDATISDVRFDSRLGAEAEGRIRACILQNGATDAQSVVVERCQFYTFIDTADPEYPVAAVVTNSSNTRSNFVVRDCFFGPNAFGSARSHIVSKGGPVFIQDNTMMSSIKQSIVLLGYTHPHAGSLIAGNSIRPGAGSESGILLQGDSTSFASNMSDVAIHDNVIVSAGGGSADGYGIYLRALNSPIAITRVSICDNHILASTGIYLEESGGGVVDSTMLDGNYLVGCGTAIDDSASNTYLGFNAT